METMIPLVLVLAGLALVAAGLLAKAGAGGRLPGDLRGTRGPVTFAFPLGASLLVSLLLTVVLNAALCGVQR